MKNIDTEYMKNNPIEELRNLASPVTEEGWASIVEDPRYKRHFGKSPKPSPKGRIAIIAGAVAVLVIVPILVKTLSHKPSETAAQPVATETPAQQATAADNTAGIPQSAPTAQPKTPAQPAPKQTVSTVNGSAAHEQSALATVTGARPQAAAPALPMEPAAPVTAPKTTGNATADRPATTPSTPKPKTASEPVKPAPTAASQGETPKSEPETEEPAPDADQFFIPSAFTPNGDGLNDLFYVKANFEPRNFELTIFNRGGGRVFQTRDMNIGWDGKMHDTTLPFGMYVYLIKYKDSQGNELQKQGQILLIP